MNREQLRALQAPLKHRYQSEPESAIAVLTATGQVDPVNVGCHVDLLANNGRELMAGLHPLAGGDGTQACSGDLLLQALVTCAGTTLAAVALSLEIPLAQAQVEARGTMDFRGTLAVDRSAPVGFTSIELTFRVESTATSEQLDKLIQLTERYCVVARTLASGVPIRSSRQSL